jgi:hypothetical protein
MAARWSGGLIQRSQSLSGGKSAKAGVLALLAAPGRTGTGVYALAPQRQAA